MGKFGAACLASSARTIWGCPTSITRTPSSRAARTLPSTSGRGALSPPMASTAIVIIGFTYRQFLDGTRQKKAASGRLVQHGAAFVEAAMGTSLVRLLGFVAIRAFAERRFSRKSWARLVLVRRFECRLFGLGIAILLVPASVGGFYGLSALKTIVFSASPASGAREGPAAGPSRGSHSGTPHGSGLHRSLDTVPGSHSGK